MEAFMRYNRLGRYLSRLVVEWQEHERAHITLLEYVLNKRVGQATALVLSKELQKLFRPSYLDNVVGIDEVHVPSEHLDVALVCRVPADIIRIVLVLDFVKLDL